MNYIAYIKDFFEIKIIKKKFFKRNEILKEDTINSLYLNNFENSLNNFFNQEILLEHPDLKKTIKKTIKNEYFFFTESKMDSELKRVFKSISNESFIICPIKETKDHALHKSSDDISTKFKNLHHLENKKIIHAIYSGRDNINSNNNLQTLDNHLLKNKSDFILLLDDYSGSGKTVINFLNELKYNLLRDLAYIDIFIYISYVTEDAKKKIRSYEINNPSMNIKFDYYKVESNNFITEEESEFIKDFSSNNLFIEYPLGFDNCKSLVSFYHNTPNNTYGLFWDYSINKWTPLFCRQGRDNARIKQLNLWEKNRKKVAIKLKSKNISLDDLITNYDLTYIDIVFFVAYNTTIKKKDLCYILGYTEKQLQVYRNYLVKSGWLNKSNKEPSDSLLDLYKNELKDITLDFEESLQPNYQNNDIIDPYSYVPKKFRLVQG